MSDVITINSDTEVDPNTALETAKGVYQDLIVVGWDLDGKLNWHCSGMNNKEVNWLIDQFKDSLIHGECK